MDERETRYYLVGKPPTADMVDFLQTSVRCLFVSGEFGSGKTTLIDALLQTNKYLFITKKTPRTARKLEREGRIPYISLSIDEIFKQIYEMDETLFICRNTIYSAGDLLDHDDSLELIKQSISVYSLTEIHEMSLDLKNKGKIFVFEITPEQEKDWVFFFPSANYVRLIVKKRIRQKRLLNRLKRDPEIDPTGKITELKIATSELNSQTEKDDPANTWYRYRLCRLSNNNLVDFFVNYVVVRMICEAPMLFKKITMIISPNKDAAAARTHGG